MKKITSLALAFLLLISVGGMTAFAKDHENDNNQGNKNRNSSQVCHYPRGLGFFFGIFSHKVNKNCSPDTIAPTISAVAVSNVSDTSVKISWNTNENATSEVLYGSSSSYTTSQWSPSFGKGHSIVIRNLQPNTTYHYQIVARDFWGNRTTSSDATFTTNAPDTVAPVITNISVEAITESSAKINFTTNESAQASVLFGANTSYGLESRLDQKANNHSIILSNLTAGTTYHYQIVARDGNGNVSRSADATFTTLVSAPTVSISNVSVTNIDNNSAVLSWQTNVATASRVDYGTSTSYGTSVSRDERVTSRSVTLTGLSANTTYHYKITARDVSGRVAISSDGTFTTTSRDVRAPIVSQLAINQISKNGAVITFRTDENASVKVYYGIGSVILGSSSVVSDSTMSTDHQITLGNLSANTLYFFVVEAKDAMGNTSISAQQAFTTSA